VVYNITMTTQEQKKKLWFKAKIFGLGWRPVSWQGWVLTIIYVLGLVNFAMEASIEHSGSDFIIKFAIKFIPLTILFLIICYMKGEKLRWRWGR
jgi:uncharacterized membrane protein YhdT